MNVVQMASLVILAIVVGVAIAARRPRRGEPFRQRPAARVLVVVAIIILVLCVILANRHGG